LGEALRRSARYSSVVNEGVSVTYIEGKEAKLALEYVGVARHVDRHQMEFFFTALVRLCRQLAGRRLAPNRVRLRHHRGQDCARLSAFFGCDVECGAAADDIAFAATIADMPIASADRYLNELLVASLEEALSRRKAKRGPFRAQVENAIAPLLPH